MKQASIRIFCKKMDVKNCQGFKRESFPPRSTFLKKIGIFFFLLIGFYFHFAFPFKSHSASSPLISHIQGARSFYITDSKSQPILVKKGSRIPLGSQFELPRKVSVKISYSKNIFFLASNKTHIRFLKRKGQPHLRILYGKIRVVLKSSHRKRAGRNKRSRKKGFYLESNEFVSKMTRGKKKRGDFIFERIPTRTALYILEGEAITAKNLTDLEKKKWFVHLEKFEYIYGRRDQVQRFKKKHTFDSTPFLKTLYSSNPYFRRR